MHRHAAAQTFIVIDKVYVEFFFGTVDSVAEKFAVPRVALRHLPRYNQLTNATGLD